MVLRIKMGAGRGRGHQATRVILVNSGSWHTPSARTKCAYEYDCCARSANAK